MRILVTGPQGSGKTTQAQILANKLGILLVDAGEMLRKLAEQKSLEGVEVKDELNKGELVEDEIVAGLVKEEVGKSAYQKGYVMDGYPRTMDSLKLFDPCFDQVFYLDVSDEEVEKRLLARGRSDDTPTLIRERLMLYHQNTQAVLDYYQNLGKLVKIDARGGIEQIAQEIDRKLVTSNE
ncbi:nucleoside monophosphate kinase [Candidatus Daviesbacteria bacterium]|nr:nucleoside monophosphate kinase [Candidatus Daviesbacteria bacterium]